MDSGAGCVSMLESVTSASSWALEDAFEVTLASEELGELTSYRAIAEALARRGVA